MHAKPFDNGQSERPRMAGGLLKTFGGILIGLGAVAFLLGAGAAAYGFIDGMEAKEDGMFADRERMQRDGELVEVGLVTAAIGLLVLLLGIVLVASGSGRANRVLVRAVREGQAINPGSASTGSASSSSNKIPSRSMAARTDSAQDTLGAPQEVRTASSSSRNASRNASKSASQNASRNPRNPDRSAGRTPSNSGPLAMPASRWIAVALIPFLLVMGILVALAFYGSVIDGESPLLGRSREPTVLGEAVFEGSIASGPRVLGFTQGAGDGSTPEAFTPPPGTARLQGHVEWTPQAACCATLTVTLQQANGTQWDTVTTVSGTPGMAFDHPVTPGTFRFRAMPAEDGMSMGQDYSIHVTYVSK